MEIITSTTTISFLLAAVLILPGIIYCLCKIPALSSRKGEIFLQDLIRVLVNCWFIVASVFCLVLVIRFILFLLQ